MYHLPTLLVGIFFGGYTVSSGPVVYGYHGTTEAAALQLLANPASFRSSRRPASWLGYGRYFFQDAPGHAETWAHEVADRRTKSSASGKVHQPAVLRATLDLSNCMDLIDKTYWPFLKTVWSIERANITTTQVSAPQTLQYPDTDEARYNYVDCEIMNTAIQILKKQREEKGMALTTVRAAFMDGTPVHPTSWLYDFSHVVVTVLDPVAIKDLRRV